MGITRSMFLKSKKIAGFAAHQIQIAGKTVLIREASLADTKKLVEIEEAVYTGSAPWDQQAFVAEISRQHGKLYLSASIDDQTIAFLGLSYRKSSQDLHITNIAVLPIWQSKGLGSYLMKLAGKLVLDNHLTTLSLEVRQSNFRAFQLYEKIGFKKTQELVGYYDGDHEDAIEMEWQL